MLRGNHFAIEWIKYLSLSFALIIVFFVALNEFFQLPLRPADHLPTFESPVKTSVLETLHSMTITNGFGRYELAKEKGSWELHLPRSLHARNELVEQIITSLKNLRVRHLYQKDKINLQNFSLDNPTIEIHLKSTKQTQKLKIGLINSIDDSTYLMDDQSSLIYQIDLFRPSLQSLGLEDFIDSHIFKETIDKIQQIRVAKHLSKRGLALLNLIQKEKIWSGKRGEKLNQQRVNEWMTGLFSKKAEVILDQRGPELENRIAKIMERPFFSVTFQKNDKSQSRYKLSYPLTSLPGIKLEKKKFILVTSSDGGHPILAHKSILDLIKTKMGQLKSIHPSKIIY
ncbi:MAG: DUF4340 domain-containing protein [Bacteriovoracales bacterium]|nr:DUF4340 domain-containing protein [Bacteriovoracales bacterium]